MSTESWTVKNVCSRTGMEGLGFSCTLYRDGKRVAAVDDWGDGGPVYFEWATPEDAAAFNIYCDRLPPWSMEGSELMRHTPDIVVCQLVDDAMEEKRMRRLCKTQVLFRRAHDPDLAEGEWRTFKLPFTQQLVKKIQEKYGHDAIILNFKYGQPAP